MVDNELLQAIGQMITASESQIMGEMATIKNELEIVKSDLEIVKSDLEAVKNRVASIEMTLESETNRNIKIIAEGYLDLTRKLDDALKVENENEMLQIRENILENELRKIKERLNKTA